MRKGVCFTMTKKITGKLIWIICFAVLLFGILFNFPLKYSAYGVAHFDTYSEGIVISDLMYQQHWGFDSLFLEMVNPDMIYQTPELNEKYFDAANMDYLYVNMFSNGEVFPQDAYEPYLSNVVVQRYLYALLDMILPLDNADLLVCLQVLNSAFLAAMVATVVVWIGKITHPILPIPMSIILALLCPSFIMYGKNLYWCAGMLFLPFVCNICLLESRFFKELPVKKKRVALAAVAFLSCFLKQIFYFEFITAVMIAMTLPVFYLILSEKPRFKEALGFFSAEVVGAFVSFVAALAVRTVMMVVEGGWKLAYEMMVYNILARIVGTTSSGNALLTESAESGYREVIGIMMEKNIFCIGNYAANMWLVIVLCIIFMIVYVLSCKKIKNVNKNWKILTRITAVSMLAPMSWFIMAKPHTYVHNWHCTFLWFMPFVPFVMALVGYSAVLIIDNVRGKTKF